MAFTNLIRKFILVFKKILVKFKYTQSIGKLNNKLVYFYFYFYII